MKRNSLTGKVKGNSGELHNNKWTLETIAGKIRVLFSKEKEQAPQPVELDETIDQTCYLRPFKVVEVADLEYIMIMMDVGYIVIADVSKLMDYDRKLFLADLKIRLWENGKQYFEVNNKNIICGELRISQYQRKSEIGNRK